jgi:hypothetical protein
MRATGLSAFHALTGDAVPDFLSYGREWDGIGAILSSNDRGSGPLTE